ncbi:MAG: c-type cytochrome [Castellaniella sp.]|nr:c-type cytochrome [Castellaniella sp.]
MSHHRSLRLCLTGLALALGLSAGALAQSTGAVAPRTYAVKDKNGQPLPAYTIPEDSEMLKHPDAEQILYGQRLLNETQRLLPDRVGAAMNCNSCHVVQGKKPLGAPFINTYNSFPQYNPRSERVMTLEERINGCMIRSMNGKKLPQDSREMQAMVAYMKWLAQDVPHGAQVQIQSSRPIDMNIKPDPVRGRTIYGAQCASCHGANGEGRKDARGNIVFPPLWGDESFNIGAGLARTYKAASFIYDNMPMGVHTKGAWGEGRTLSLQDAVDVAEFFTHMPRPDLPMKDKDWPSGKKPKDARY